jgi:hypothetical protein
MMTEELIREIARQIVQEQLLYNWAFYLVLLALLFLSHGLTFVVSYFRKRGETYATKADLEELIAQLRATTTAAEEVKTAIAHSDWTTKEWKTLRRVKLEELLGAVYAVEGWLDDERSIRLFNRSKDSKPFPFWKVNMIAGLYFPELCDEIKVLSGAYYRYNIWLLDVQGRMMAAGNYSAKAEIQKAVMGEITPYQKDLLQAVSEIQRKGPAIMKEIVGV